MKKIFTLTILLLAINLSYAQVAPLIQTQWNQNCYYNASLPAINGGPCGYVYAGCVATAMSQVMKYYSFPSSGMGSHCDTVTGYTSNCIDFSNETYNYAAMPNTLTSANADIANLMYSNGVAVDMAWGATASAAYNSSMMLAFKSNFKYSPKMYYQLFSLYQNDTSALIGKMKVELNAGRPIIINSPNHTYIIDGYNNKNQFHCNFGWAGLCDGYYNITNVSNVNSGSNLLNPVYIIFYITPMLAEIEINAGYGFDSADADTITFQYNGGSYGNFEFTSTTNWTVSIDSSWILLNMTPTSGSLGFYHDNRVFITGANTGYDRIGHIYIKSANDEEIIVVIQKGLLGPASITTNTILASQSTTIKAYPNPANTIATISVNDQALPGMISITDMQGRIIKSESLNQPEWNVDLGNVLNGCYFVQFNNNTSSVTEKLVVVH